MTAAHRAPYVQLPPADGYLAAETGKKKDVPVPGVVALAASSQQQPPHMLNLSLASVRRKASSPLALALPLNSNEVGSHPCPVTSC
jgi:hypothetical protein